MPRTITATAFLALFFVAMDTVAQAQTLEDYVAMCNGPSPQTRIQACTELLGDSRMADESLTDVYNNRGLAYSELGKYTLAIPDFDQAIEASPSNVAAYSNRGVVYDNLGQPQRAMEDFDKAIKIDPKYAHAYNNRCYVQAKGSAAQNAISDCEQASRLAPGDAEVLDTLGYVHLRLGEYSQAIDAYNAALKASPSLAASLYGRGVAEFKLGDPQGNSDMRAAIEADKEIARKMEKIGVTPGSISPPAASAAR